MCPWQCSNCLWGTQQQPVGNECSDSPMKRVAAALTPLLLLPLRQCQALVRARPDPRPVEALGVPVLPRARVCALWPGQHCSRGLRALLGGAPLRAAPSRIRLLRRLDRGLPHLAARGQPPGPRVPPRSRGARHVRGRALPPRARGARRLGLGLVFGGGGGGRGHGCWSPCPMARPGARGRPPRLRPPGERRAGGRIALPPRGLPRARPAA